MLRKMVPLLAILSMASLNAYEIGQLNRSYIDPSRDNRQIGAVVYYPLESQAGKEDRAIFPLMVFGHGWIMPVSLYSALWQEFVPYGWIMAFPTTESGLFPNHLDFALDLEFVLQSVQAENWQDGSELYGIVAPFAVLTGHSMGGGASVLAASNTSASALVTLAAANTDPSAISAAAQVFIPSLTLSGSSDTITPPAQHQMPIFENLASSYKSYVSFNGVGHLNIYGNTLVFSVILSWLEYAQSGDLSVLDSFYSLLEQNANALEYMHSGYPSLAAEEQENAPHLPRLAIWPNPCNPSALLSYSLARDSEVWLDIYDLRGRKVRSLFQGVQLRGNHSQIFDGRNEDDSHLAAGIYLARLRHADGETWGRLSLLK
ncbi:MAG: hypothetical protein K0B87_00430 [Candidatus Syntrophosphaera sp.]|nr:hypothetical protein [Candidatus Syntrophosphaera sp.]